MSEELNKGANAQTEEVQNKDSSQEEQPQKKEEVNPLQPEYTKARQALVEKATKLAQLDPKTILEESDIKVQNSVIRNVYGLENLAELKAIHGENFFEAKKEEDLDELETLRRKVAIIENRSMRDKVDGAIREFKKTNTTLFQKEGTEDEFRTNLELISGSIDIEKRIEMAGRITFGSGYDPVGSAYRDMAKATANNGGSMAEEKTKTKASAEENALRKLLGLEQK